MSKNIKLSCYTRGGCYVNPDEAEAIYVWTCSFRQDAKDNTIAKIKELRTAYPSTELIICGCMTTIDPEATATLAEEVSAKVVPWKQEEDYFNKEELQACDIAYGSVPVAPDIAQYKKDHPDKPASFADQFVKLFISEGCTCNCTYCSEKLAFPPYKSFQIEELVKRCRMLLKQANCYRVILVADSPGEYGRDIGTDITKLMDALYAVDERIQIVLSNFHPKFYLRYFDYFRTKLQAEKIFHINLPIQSACTKVLSSMNRGYSQNDLTKIFSSFREDGFDRFDTHILCGFDGETAEDFEETVRFLCRWQPRYLLISKYMYAKPGESEQNRKDAVSEEEKIRRALYLAEKAQTYGAIVNYEGSELGKDRWNRLNQADRRTQ